MTATVVKQRRWRAHLSCAAEQTASVKWTTHLCSLWVVVCGLVIGTGRSTLGQAEEPVRLDAGALQLEIFFSRTAHLFHVVDQLAEWSEFSHRQYGRYFDQLDGGYSARDRELLAKHTAIRAVHGWGNGLEQTFYASAGLESALQLGVQQ